MPRKKVYTSFEMSDRQLKNWQNRTKRGGAFELDGAFRDSVFVPRTTSDIDPNGATQKNRLRLQRMRQIIKDTQESKQEFYIA